MAVLTLIRRSPAHAEHQDSILKIMEKRGFSAPEIIQSADYSIILHPSLMHPDLPLAQDAEGNIATAGGTLLYKGRHGAAAMEAVLADTKARAFSEEDCSGCFVLVLALNGQLTFFTDQQGLYKFHRACDGDVWSSSFLACCAAMATRRVNTQALYEYVFQGATYGEDTLLDDVTQVDCRKRYSLKTEGPEDTTPRAFPFHLEQDVAPLEVHVSRIAETLRQTFGDLLAAFDGHVDTALSGGYDSRLVLALLRDQGHTPDLHVYGGENDPDVLVAKRIAEGEGITLIHDNKGRYGDNSPEGVAQAVADQFWAFDGLPTDGIVGNGSDLATRKARASVGGLALNGGGGEVFRNFFYLPGGSYSLRDVLWTFYSQYDPAAGGPLFDEAVYTQTLMNKIGTIFPEPRDGLSRTDVEFVYPGFRGRFWTGRNTSLNNQFGPALTPFFEATVVADALRVPLAYKNHGIFEAELINAIDPKLAAYPSSYGHAFDAPPPLGKRLADWTTYLRPPWLRRLTYRIKNRRQSPVNKVFFDEYRKLYLPQGLAVMEPYFDLSRVHHPEQLNRIHTLAYWIEAMNVEVG